MSMFTLARFVSLDFLVTIDKKQVVVPRILNTNQIKYIYEGNKKGQCTIIWGTKNKDTVVNSFKDVKSVLTPLDFPRADR